MSNHVPEPSATPINVENCEVFKPVVGIVGRFLDLNIHVEKINKNLNCNQNDLEYNVDFGDGNRLIGESLNADKQKSLIAKSKATHQYKKINTYNAVLSVDDPKRRVRSCATVPVYIQSETPDLCSEIHIQSSENSLRRINEFYDESENEYKIFSSGVFYETGIDQDGEVFNNPTTILPEHVDNTSPYRDGFSIYFQPEFNQYLEVENTNFDFRFIHNNDEEEWTIESWINLSSEQAIHPIILNSTKTGEIGFQLYIQDNNQIIFSIFNDKEVSNIDRDCKSLMTTLPVTLCEDPSKESIDGVIARINQEFIFETNEWYHIAVIKAGSIVNLYINGKKIGTSTYYIDQVTEVESGRNLLIGYMPGSEEDSR